MAKIPKTLSHNSAKSRLYKTPRGDYMTDRGDGNIVPIVKVGANEYQQNNLTAKIHDVPAAFTDLATIYDAPVYQIQFLGHGTSIDLYSRGLPEAFESLKLLCEHYLIPNGEQEVRFYYLDERDGWQNVGGLYSADLANIDLDFGEFEALFQGGVND